MPKAGFWDGLLLFLLILAIPFQNQIQILPGVSLAWALFGVCGVYFACAQIQPLNEMLFNRFLIPLYLLVIYAFLVETFKPYRDYSEIIQILQMVIGTVFVAAFIRSRQMLSWAAFSVMASATILSIFFISNTYTILATAVVGDAYAASEVRLTAFEALNLKINLNEAAFFNAIGTVSAMVLLLDSKLSFLVRTLAAATGLICCMGTFLPMSRSGVLVLGVCIVIVLLTHGVRFWKLAFFGLAAAGLILFALPGAVMTRVSSTNAEYEGKSDSRFVLLEVATSKLSEYWASGVGAGNFWNVWAPLNGFSFKEGVAVGAHNSFLQATLYWGFGASLLLIIGVLGIVLSSITVKSGDRELKSLVRTYAVAFIMFLMFTHTLYSKELSVALGLCIGAQTWLIGRNGGRLLPDN